MDFFLYKFKRKGSTLHEDVLCRDCYERTPELRRVSDREYAAGYRQETETIAVTYPATCQECGATREAQTCAMCNEPRSPYDPTLCTNHLNKIGSALSRAFWSFRDQMEKAA